MPFIDELDQLLDDLVQQKLNEHVAAANLPPPAQAALAAKFQGAREQFKLAHAAELERIAIAEEIDSLRARLDVLEGN